MRAIREADPAASPQVSHWAETREAAMIAERIRAEGDRDLQVRQPTRRRSGGRLVIVIALVAVVASAVAASVALRSRAPGDPVARCLLSGTQHRQQSGSPGHARRGAARALWSCGRTRREADAPAAGRMRQARRRAGRVSPSAWPERGRGVRAGRRRALFERWVGGLMLGPSQGDRRPDLDSDPRRP